MSRTNTSAGKASIPATGRGWTAQYIDVGVTTNQDVSTFARTLGVNSLDSGDQKADAQAMIAHINSAGGLFGRKLRGVYLDIKTTDDPNSSAQAACAYFTQDHPVIAVVNGAVENDQQVFRDCMSQHQVPVLALGDTPLDEKGFTDARGFYDSVIVPSWNRMAPVLTQRLAAQGWFGGWDTVNGRPTSTAPKIGLIALDTPIGHRISTIVADALHSAGHPLADTFFYANQSDLQAAVLHFRSDGVTHVIDTDQFLFEFAEQAQSQHYHPRYGVVTQNAPYELLQGVVPKQQLLGSMGVGFDPGLDVALSQDPRKTPRAASCRAIMAHAGINYGSRRFADAYALAFCDAFTLLTDATATAGGLSPGQIVTGLAAVGSSYQPASTFASGLSAKDHSLPGAVFDLHWDARSLVFRYDTSRTYPM